MDAFLSIMEKAKNDYIFIEIATRDYSSTISSTYYYGTLHLDNEDPWDLFFALRDMDLINGYIYYFYEISTNSLFIYHSNLILV